MNSSTSAPNESLSDKATQAGQHLKEAARDAAGRAREGVSSTASKLKQTAAEMAEQRRAQAAERVGRAGQTLHETANSMEEEDPNIAHYAHRLADRLDYVADYVRNRDLTAFKDDAAELARRHPVAFLGGLFVAGLVIGNLVKAGATATSQTGSTTPDGTGSASRSTTASTAASSDPDIAAASPAGI